MKKKPLPHPGRWAVLKMKGRGDREPWWAINPYPKHDQIYGYEINKSFTTQGQAFEYALKRANGLQHPPVFRA